MGPSGYVCGLGSSCWRQPLFSEGKRQDSRDARSSSRLSPALSAVAERDRDVGDKDGGGWGLGVGEELALAFVIFIIVIIIVITGVK